MTDRVVLKWPVSVDDRPHPIGGGEVVHVAVQYPDDFDSVTVWTVEPRDTHARPRQRTVQVYGTGHPLPYFATHLGSAIAANGGLVWHVFCLPEIEPQLPKVAGANAGANL